MNFLTKLILLIPYLIVSVTPCFLQAQNQTKIDSLKALREFHTSQIREIDKSIKVLQQSDTTRILNSSVMVEPSSERYEDEYQNEQEKQNIERLQKLGVPLYLASAKVTYNSIGVPEAVITIKNISDKTIDAYTLNIYCYNRFDEPVTHNNVGSNKFIGISQEILLPKRTERDAVWTLFGFETTAKIEVTLGKVHFKDGDTWYPSKGKSSSIKGKSSG